MQQIQNAVYFILTVAEVKIYSEEDKILEVYLI